MDKNNQEKYFFIKLKEQRKSKNISIDDVCNDTKINKEYIEAIENGDFDVLPKVYLKLFLKTYANYIGADNKQVLIEYKQFCSGTINYKNKKTPEFIKNKHSLKKNNNLKINSSNSPYFISKNKVLVISFTIIIVFTILYSISSIWSYEIPEDWNNKKNFTTSIDKKEPINLSNNLINDSIYLNIKYLNTDNEFTIDDKKFVLNNLNKNKEHKFTKKKDSYFEFKLYNGNAIFLIDGNEVELGNIGKILGKYDSGSLTLEYYR